MGCGSLPKKKERLERRFSQCCPLPYRRQRFKTTSRRCERNLFANVDTGATLPWTRGGPRILAFKTDPGPGWAERRRADPQVQKRNEGKRIRRYAAAGAARKCSARI